MVLRSVIRTSTNSYIRDSNHRGKRLKIFKRDRPDRLPPGPTLKLVLRLHSSEFLLIGIIGRYCVPTVAGWIIGAGGGIGSYERNVNQTAQRGTQGAYTGSKAMGGGAQVLLPVMSFDVSKGALIKGEQISLGLYLKVHGLYTINPPYFILKTPMALYYKPSILYT